MRSVLVIIFLCIVASAGFAQTSNPPARNYPAPVEGDYVIQNFRFHSGETLPELRIPYRTIGSPTRDGSGLARNAVLIGHGTGGAGTQFVSQQFAHGLFGPGQVLDASRSFIILPDDIGPSR